MGYVNDLGYGRVHAPRDLIQRLEAADIERAGKALAAERGLPWRRTVPGTHITGNSSAPLSYPAAGSPCSKP
jgi:hypothetical protein